MHKLNAHLIIAASLGLALGLQIASSQEATGVLSETYPNTAGLMEFMGKLLAIVAFFLDR